MKLPKKPRPVFARWRYERGLTVRQTADLLQQATGRRICSHEKVRTLCLPFGDGDRTEPDDELAAAIEALTGGEVTAADFRLAATSAAA